MSKYHELIELYAGMIEHIEELKAEDDRLREQIVSIDVVDERGRIDWDKVDEKNDLCEQRAEVQTELNQYLAELDHEITVEYGDVPFAKPRQAGIDGFYRESGLADLFPNRYR